MDQTKFRDAELPAIWYHAAAKRMVIGNTTTGMGMTDSAGKSAKQSRWERVYTVVRRIPRGSVATYGQIALLAGLGGDARQVGYALHALPARSRVPWHRVINSRGGISLHPESGGDVTQHLMLEREGVRFNAAGRTDLKRFGWKPPG